MTKGKQRNSHIVESVPQVYFSKGREAKKIRVVGPQWYRGRVRQTIKCFAFPVKFEMVLHLKHVFIILSNSIRKIL